MRRLPQITTASVCNPVAAVQVLPLPIPTRTRTLAPLCLLPQTGLNNSVGRTNYGQFIVLLLGLCAMLFLQCVLAFIGWIEWIADRDTFELRADRTLGGIDATALAIVYMFIALLSLVMLAPVLQLTGFHAFLAREGITTYEFVADKQRTDAGIASVYRAGPAGERRARRAHVRRTNAAVQAIVLARMAAPHMPGEDSDSHSDEGSSGANSSAAGAGIAGATAATAATAAATQPAAGTGRSLARFDSSDVEDDGDCIRIAVRSTSSSDDHADAGTKSAGSHHSEES